MSNGIDLEFTLLNWLLRFHIKQLASACASSSASAPIVVVVVVVVVVVCSGGGGGGGGGGDADVDVNHTHHVDHHIAQQKRHRQKREQSWAQLVKRSSKNEDSHTNHGTKIKNHRSVIGVRFIVSLMVMHSLA